jgi:mitochondrial fission protein ELM1
LHDGFTGGNVINTFGAVHSVTEARLAAARAAFGERIGPLPRPRIVVLLGGDSAAFKFPPDLAARFGEQLAHVARSSGGSLLVTPSRRTSPEAMRALAAAIAELPHFIWDGAGANPYYALLGAADVIVTTEDSVNMVTEAAGTGRPVYVQKLSGRSRRLGRFHALMRERGVTRPFEGRIESWSYAPINDTALVGSAIRKALAIESKE